MERPLKNAAPDGLWSAGTSQSWGHASRFDVAGRLT